MFEESESKMYISGDSPLLFMHIPKTGGMSLFTAFTSIWGEDIADLYDISRRNQSEALHLIGDHRKAIYCGHYAFGLHQWLDRDCYYASFMREPISRLVSLYHYCQPMLKSYRRRLAAMGGDIDALSRQPRISDFYLDFEPWLRGAGTSEEFFASPSAELDNGMVRRFSGYGLGEGKCPDEALDQAKENIERSYSLVGILERYPESLELMSKIFRLPSLNVNHVNGNSDKERNPPLSSALIDKIASMNQLDVELYRWALERFDRQYKSASAPVKIEPGLRKDLPVEALWKAVGQSPLRQKAMKERGVPGRAIRPGVPAQMAVCNRLVGVRVNARAILADMELVEIANGKPSGKGQVNRLVLSPALTKNLIVQLQKAIDAHENKFGSEAVKLDD